MTPTGSRRPKSPHVHGAGYFDAATGDGYAPDQSQHSDARPANAEASQNVAPRTQAGRELVEDEPRLVTGEHLMLRRVLAIESEAASPPSELREALNNIITLVNELRCNGYNGYQSQIGFIEDQARVALSSASGTAAGRALEREIGGDYGEEIAAIEAEAASEVTIDRAEQSVPLDAEALAELAYADRPPLGPRPVPMTYVRRKEWTAWARRIAEKYARLVDGAQAFSASARAEATPQPADVVPLGGNATPTDVDRFRERWAAAHPAGSALSGVASGEADTALREARLDQARTIRAAYHGDQSHWFGRWLDGEIAALAAQPIQASPSAKPTSAEDSE